MSDVPTLESLLGSHPTDLQQPAYAAAATVEPASKADELIARMIDDEITELQANGWADVFYTKGGSRYAWNGALWASSEEYVLWLDQFVRQHTDSREGVLADPDRPFEVIDGARHPVYNPRVDRIEASLVGNLYGSIHLQMPYTTARRVPILTVRRQPRTAVSLDEMVAQGVMNQEQAALLEAAVAGRANILVAGGSGAGKTTLLRALAAKVDPNHRIVTIETANELNLNNVNVVPLLETTHYDNNGDILREVTTEDLIRDSLRMRADRIWVGEVRGGEAAVLSKACRSGHDGSMTTIHATDAEEAVHKLVQYNSEAGLDPRTATQNAVQAFDMVVHIATSPRGARKVTAIAEIDPVIEDSAFPQPRILHLWKLNPATGYPEREFPPNRLARKLAANGVSVPWAPQRSY